MSDKFNPFAAWLGLDKGDYLPNHFQLFGVKPISDDPIGFRKTVHSKAKKMLAKLEGMSEEEIGEHAKLHVRVRKHVVKAHATLMDDKLRATYIKQLREKVRQKKAGQPLATPPPQKTTSSPPPKKKSQPAILQPSTSEVLSQPHTSEIIKGSASGIDATDLALPMAIPLKKETVVAADSESDGPDFSGLANEEISIKPGRVRRKKSWLIPALGAVMAVFGVAVIGYLVMNFPNRLDELIGKKDPDPQPAVVNDTETEVDPAAKPESSAEELRNSVENAANSGDAVPELKDPGNINVDMDGGNGSAAKSDPPPAEPETEMLSPVTLSGPQLQSIRYTLKRAHRAMRRGQLSRAAGLLDATQSQIGGMLQGEQVVLKKRLDDSRNFLELVQGFWKQVKSSTMKITAGELKMDSGQIIGFVSRSSVL